MSVFKTLNLVDCANKRAWEEIFRPPVTGTAVASKLPEELRAQVLSVGDKVLSDELRAIRASERSIPESLLRMKLR